MSPEKLYAAVAKLLEDEAFVAEQEYQKREFSKNERIAFRRGFYRGLAADVHRAGTSMWERAAKEISK